MLNFYKFIEILVSLQSLIISTMLPVYIQLPFINKSSISLDMPITWQIPTIFLLTLIFKRKVVFRAFTIYIILGLLVAPSEDGLFWALTKRTQEIRCSSSMEAAQPFKENFKLRSLCLKSFGF